MGRARGPDSPLAMIHEREAAAGDAGPVGTGPAAFLLLPAGVSQVERSRGPNRDSQDRNRTAAGIWRSSGIRLAARSWSSTETPSQTFAGQLAPQGAMSATFSSRLVRSCPSIAGVFLIRSHSLSLSGGRAGWSSKTSAIEAPNPRSQRPRDSALRTQATGPAQWASPKSRRG